MTTSGLATSERLRLAAAAIHAAATSHELGDVESALARLHESEVEVSRAVTACPRLLVSFLDAARARSAERRKR